MRHILFLSALLFSLFGFAQKPAPAGADSGRDLEPVLSAMDKASSSFKSAQANFQWDQYQKVVDETDVQKGQVYFRRNHHGIDAAFEINSPGSKNIVFKDGKIRIYEKKIDQLTERDVSKNRSDVEAFMSLGFGGRGHDLRKSYEVKMAGWETVDQVKTAKLELIPISPKVRNMI